MEVHEDAVSKVGVALIDRLKSAKNLSAVARHAGLALKTLSRIRDGVNSPTLETASKIMRALNAVVERRTPEDDHEWIANKKRAGDK